ncbi:MAG: SAM-dependent methyltransferase [Proteobacteria bacterium]|nr:SAM-dependent methyltransferase [Pseudomonadota bacterium]
MTRVQFLATLLISAAAIAYEILLMRMLSIVQWHHFAYMIISLALLGYGTSGTVIAICRRWLEPRFELVFSISGLLFSITMVACFVLGQRVPFNALEIVWDARQFINLSIIYIVFFVPFFFAACCIGMAFTCRPSHISRIYFFDLLGAGLGALLIVGLLFLLSVQSALIMLAVLALLASALMAITSTARKPLAVMQLVCLATLLFGLPQEWLVLRISEYKGLQQTMQVVGSNIVHVSSSPLGLLTVVESPRIPFRYAPGLSLNTRFEPPEQLAVFIDGDSMSVITRFDGNLDALGYMGDVTAALPYALLDAPHVLILGAGGGTDVLFALYNGAARVDAVELNPQMTRLVTDTYADFAGYLYDDERITIHTQEARGFVVRSNDQYDLIQVALLDSFAASGSGVQALSESYLYTVEAIQDYLKNTAAGGMLAITRWLKLPPRDNLKLVATVIEALRETGVAEPGRQLALIRSWNTSTLLVKNGEFSAADITVIRQFADSRSFDTAFFPSMTAHDANRFNLLDQPFLYDGVNALLGDDADDFVARYKFYIAPATDNKPYFFHFFKWSSLPEVMALRKRGGAGLIEWGYLILVATAIQAAIAGVLLILLPLSRVKRRWPRGTGSRMGSYFFLLGLAFLFIEIAFIQKFILFLSHPLYAVAVVLSGFLVFAGLGSAYSAQLVQRVAQKRHSPVSVAVAGIAAIALLYLAVLPMLFQQLIGLPDAIKMALSIILIAPMAFFMGMPFPIVLARVADRAPDFIPWAWGINGFASVISASLATLLAIEFGFSVVILLALGLYATAAAVVHD